MDDHFPCYMTSKMRNKVGVEHQPAVLMDVHNPSLLPGPCVIGGRETCTSGVVSAEKKLGKCPSCG